MNLFKNILLKVLLIFLLSGTLITQWLNLVNLNNNVRTITYSGSNIYAAVGGSSFGVYHSVNNGVNWLQTPISQTCIPLTISSSYIFTGTMYNGVFVSANNGTNWSQTSLNDKNIISLTGSGNKIYAGPSTGVTGFGVQYSSNYGADWIQTSLNNVWVIALAAAGSYVYAGTYNDGVYVSTNEGLTWIHSPLNNRRIHSLTVRGSNIFAGTENYGLYISANNGLSWVQSALNNVTVRSIEVNGNNIYAGTFQQGVYVSGDLGTTWIQRNEGLGNDVVYTICIINDYIFAGTSNSIFRRQLSELTNVLPVSAEIPSSFLLSQNYPNPFNPKTNFEFQIADFGFVNITIFNATGREVETIVNEEMNPGTYKAEWNAANYPSGVYFYKMNTNSSTETRKMILIK